MGFNRWNDLAAVSHPGLQPVVEEMLSTEGGGDINAPMGFFRHSLHLAFGQGHRDVIGTCAKMVQGMQVLDPLSGDLACRPPVMAVTSI